MSKKVITDVPESELQSVISDFTSEGCQAVGSKQDNGLFKVTAECPDTRAVADNAVVTEAH